MTYEVVVDGQVRQAHVDHLRPCPENYVEPNQPKDSQSALADEDIDETQNPFLFMDDDDGNSEPNRHSLQLAVEQTGRPHHNCRPPKWLIEEID